MKNEHTPLREDWHSLCERIDRSFFGDHDRPKGHIMLSRKEWERIKQASDEQCHELDEAAIARLLKSID